MNVARFAAVSVVSKEWLFRITRREQSSPARESISPLEPREASSLIAIPSSDLFPTPLLDPIIGCAYQPKTPPFPLFTTEQGIR
jgi:hypothetical protein